MSRTFGKPRKITFLPKTLKFSVEWDANNPGHVGIMPQVGSGITQANVQQELNKIRTEVAE